MITSAYGRVMDKAGYLKDAKTRKYLTVEYNDVKVTTFGDTAIATGGYKGTVNGPSGKVDENERWTDTWVKMPDGKWQCVASQSASVKK